MKTKIYSNDNGEICILKEHWGMCGTSALFYDNDMVVCQYQFSKLRKATKPEVNELWATMIGDLDFEDFQDFVKKSKVIHIGDGSRENTEWDIELIIEYLD